MSFVYALVFSLLSLLPIAALSQDQEPLDNHPLIKCNFPNAQAEPLLTTVIIDPEWSQIISVSREGKILPPETNLKLQIEMRPTTPASYVWTMLNKKGEQLIQIQELATDPPRFSILGRKPGTYDCYQQYSKMIEYYKRF